MNGTRMDEHDGWRRWARIIGIAAVAIGILAALSIRHTIRSAVRHGARPEHVAAPIAPARAALPPPAEPAHGAQPQLGPHVAPDPADTAPSEPAPVPRRRSRQEPDDLAGARQAILDATPEALVKGKPVKWQAGHLGGYVVPSERQDYEDRVCRNIYATTIDGPDQLEGRARRWCRPADGDGWAPE